MSSIRTILMHLDATQRTATRVRVAEALAEQLDATVAATYAVLPQLPSPAAMTEVAAYAAMLQDLDDGRLERARAAFDAARPGPRVNWRELGSGPVVPNFIRAAFTSDLLVLGQHDPAADEAATTVPADFVETVVIDSGRPAVIVPYAGECVPLGRIVLVAWKPTRESARALSASLPLLRRAQRVHVAGWNNDPKEVEHLLLRHGIDPVFHSETRVGADIGDYVLSRASELGADLLVMGCYGHSRSRELVLGGASRTVLQSMTLPVLMAH